MQFVCALFILIVPALSSASTSVSPMDTLRTDSGLVAPGPTDSLDLDSLSSPLPPPDTISGLAPHFVVEIESRTATAGKIRDTLDVTIESFGATVAAFDFKIGVDSRYLSIISVLPGEIYDSCGWQFFNARSADHAGAEGVPAMVWQTVAIAESISSGARPTCFGFDRKASLLRIVVASPELGVVPDTTVPLFFYWESCADNTLSSVSGNTLALSSLVVDHRGDTLRLDSAAVFPVRAGTPEGCIDPDKQNRPRRQVEFHNGCVEFRFELDVEIDSSAPHDASRSPGR